MPNSKPTVFPRRTPWLDSGPATVGDVMVTAVVAAHEDAPFKEIVASLYRNRISAVPVIDSTRRVRGVVSESDLLARLSGGLVDLPRGHFRTARSEARAKLRAATARELMTAPAVITTAETSIAAAAAHAGKSRVRRLPVVDRDGRLVGIVTKGDLLRAFLRPDKDIRSDVVENIVIGDFALDPTALDISVAEGVVTLRGQVERKLLAQYLLEAIRGLNGVVDVAGSELTYRVDDLARSIPRVPL